MDQQLAPAEGHSAEAVFVESARREIYSAFREGRLDEDATTAHLLALQQVAARTRTPGGPPRTPDN